MAAITGWRQRSGAATLRASTASCSGERVMKAGMSPPLEKCFPSARSTITRTPSSASSVAKTAASWSRCGMLTTLSGGRSSTMSARAVARSTSTRKPSRPSKGPLVVMHLSRRRPRRRRRRRPLRIRPRSAGAAGPCLPGTLGSRGRRHTREGRLKSASADARQWASSPAASTGPPRTTKAATFCPQRSSARPATAASATAGWTESTLSISAGSTFSPPVMIMSSTRPVTKRSPSASQ